MSRAENRVQCRRLFVNWEEGDPIHKKRHRCTLTGFHTQHRCHCGQTW